MLTDRVDQRCRRQADLHYSRQSPGASRWIRPGWTQVLWCQDAKGMAVWVWWRPKWEAGVERKDKLRCVENVFFRNATAWLSSELIVEAVAAGLTWGHALDVKLPDGWITGINSLATAARRSSRALPGHCYRLAGWEVMPGRVTRRADLWLRCARFPSPEAPLMAPRGQLPLVEVRDAQS